jgi:hypothetical protein
MREVQHITETQILPFPKLAQSQYARQVAAALQWIIHNLDEAERRKNIPHSPFDAPVSERYRRAS